MLHVNPSASPLPPGLAPDLLALLAFARRPIPADLDIGEKLRGQARPTSWARLSFPSPPVTIAAATYTVTDWDVYLIANRAGGVTVTLPDAASWPGRALTIRTITADAVTSASSNVVPLAGGAAGTAIASNTAGKWALLVSDAANWQIMAAN